MNAVANLKTKRLAQSLGLSIHLRWPDAEMSFVDTEEGLLKAAPMADVVFLDELAARPTAFELIRKIRGAFDGALIILARHPNEEEMLNSLEAGGDDYLGTPFSAAQLVARVSAVFRRVSIAAKRDDSVLRCGPLEIRPDTYEAYVMGKELRLTRKEFEVLYQLAEAKGSLVTTRALQQLVWQSDEALYLDSLRKYIQRLRKKIHGLADSDMNIVVRRGVGYRLTYVGGPERYKDQPQRSAL